MKDQAKICAKKKSYDSLPAAIFFAQADGLAPYKCPVCRKWHLTSSGKRLKNFYKKKDNNELG